MTLRPKNVLDALSRALVTSRDWARDRTISNATRSARFCSDVCGNLDGLLCGAGLTPRYIRVDDQGTKYPGEWLLDGAWTEDVTPDKQMTKAVPRKIRCALECESSTSGFDYFTDFSKLLSVASDTKLFLVGLNQQTKQGAFRYINRRVLQSSALVRDQYDPTLPTDWYLAFWPSPLDVGGQSLWERIDDETLTHLRTIVLYHYVDSTFQVVGSDGSA